MKLKQKEQGLFYFFYDGSACKAHLVAALSHKTGSKSPEWCGCFVNKIIAHISNFASSPISESKCGSPQCFIKCRSLSSFSAVELEGYRQGEGDAPPWALGSNSRNALQGTLAFSSVGCSEGDGQSSELIPSEVSAFPAARAEGATDAVWVNEWEHVGLPGPVLPVFVAGWSLRRIT